jgi:hypothetical protein
VWSERDIERQGLREAWALVLAALEYDHVEHVSRALAPVGARAQGALPADFY